MAKQPPKRGAKHPSLGCFCAYIAANKTDLTELFFFFFLLRECLHIYICAISSSLLSY